jgi:hypothetical protein
MGAATTARAEFDIWAEIVGLAAEIDLVAVVPPAREQRVSGFDPTPDLARRASAWSHRLGRGDLVDLARFAAGLAIPWSDLVGRCHPDLRLPGHRVRDLLLTIADDLRVAPWLSGDEGLVPPGEDSFGPRPPRLPADLMVLGCGTVIFAATLKSMGVDGESPAGERVLDRVAKDDLIALFEIAAGRWEAFAHAHPGSARLWHDLAWRAGFTRNWLAERGTGAGVSTV